MAPLENHQNTRVRGSMVAAPSVSYTPTDTVIPPELYDKIPNLELYKQLKEGERELDLLLSRKALDFQAIQQKLIHPTSFKGETGILRVFIYNTVENQPWQKDHDTASSDSEDASWTFRVEGRFLSDSEIDSNKDSKDSEDSTELKFSSFLSAVSIDLIPNNDYPHLANSQANIIEWRDNPQDNRNTPVFDGIDIKRDGMYDLNAKVSLLVKSNSAKLRLSDHMAQFTGKLELTQQELIYQIWNYILYKDLFLKGDLTKVPVVSTDIAPDVDESDSVTLIKSDEALKSLFNVDTFKFSDIYKLIQPHFRPRQPVTVDYTINTRKSSTLGEVVLDIPIELPLNLLKIQKELLEFNKSALDSLSATDELIQQLNSKISLGIVALKDSYSKEQFYRELNSDPVNFINKWLVIQSQTLKALKSDEGYDEEIVRRSQYFVDNEQLIKDKINLLLGSSRF